jgi:predicted Zn-dependent peptidase
MKAMIHLRRYRIRALILLLAAQTTMLSQQQPDYGVRTHQLKNGMRISRSRGSLDPNVALYIFYRIGSRNERPGTTGLSHFFEHMMFNGAKKYGPKKFDEVMEAAGGSNNAFTSNDVTAYQDWFPRSALETIFDLEADRIQNLNFDEKMIESERGVVASERRTSVDNSNFGILDEQLSATAFTAHPYQWPVVGLDGRYSKLDDGRPQAPFRRRVFSGKRHDGRRWRCDARRDRQTRAEVHRTDYHPADCPLA